MKRSLAVAAAVLLAAVVAGVAFTSGVAAAQSHEIDSCTVIDEPGNYELAGDVVTDQEEACIEIRSGDVVVDGNGHTVEGPGAENVSDDARSIGVFVNESNDATPENVTVQNAAVTGFGTAVQVGARGFGGPELALENVAVRDNGGGIDHFGSRLGLTDVTVEENDATGLVASEAGPVEGTDVTIRDNGAGISGVESGVSLESSVITNNEDHGVSMGPHVLLTLTDVEVSGNGDHGIVMTSSGANVTMWGGSVTDNDGPGVTVRGGAEANLADVTVAGNGEDGLRTLGGPITVSNVTATDNADLELNGVEGEVSASDFHVGESATTAFDGESVGIEPVDREALPERDDGSAAGDGLNVSGDVDGPIELELDVDTEDETVDLWRHDGTDWETVAEDLDAADGTVEASVDRNGTYAPGTDDERDGGDGTGDGDETDDPDDGEEEPATPTPTPSDQDGEKEKGEATPTATPSDQDGEKEKETDTPTATPDGSTDCGCPSSDDDAGDADTTATVTDADDETATADRAVTESPSGDEQPAGDDATASTDGDGQATDQGDTDGDGPGPGPAVALLALLGSALLARRLG